jgi:ribosomal protein S27E
MEIRIECPRCGYVLSVFGETALRVNKTMRRAYEHALKSPILCAGCGTWVQRPRVEKVQV